jgi:hypothetical protein
MLPITAEDGLVAVVQFGIVRELGDITPPDKDEVVVRFDGSVTCPEELLVSVVNPAEFCTFATLRVPSTINLVLESTVVPATLVNPCN